MKQRFSGHNLIRNPLVWLCSGALGVVLFVFVPGLPAILEIIVLAGLMVLLGVDANRSGQHRQETVHAAAEPRHLRAPRPVTRHHRRGEAARAACGYLHVGIVDRKD